MHFRVAAIVGFLRSGSFVTAERLRLWPGAFLIGFVVAIFVLFATAHGTVDYKGRPLGSDFSNVYAAGAYAREGHPEAPFSPKLQYAKEQAIFGSATPFYGWHYPPFFLLIATPLARFPYLVALVIWQLASLALYVGALGLLLRRQAAAPANPVWFLLAVAYPAVFVNLTHGHNGFLTAALLATGLAILDERPLIAGIAFGLLAYKPQFAVLLPIVLVATGRWRVFAAAIATVLLLAAVVTLMFGSGVWPAFVSSMGFTRTVVLEQGATGFNKIQSVFAWARLWGAPVPLAYALQLASSAAVAVCLVRLWRSDATFADKGAALCLASLLATPYCLDYDMMALAPGIALLAVQGSQRGFRAYEKTLLTVLWMVPIMARGIAEATLVPVGVMAMLGVAVFLFRSDARQPA